WCAHDLIPRDGKELPGASPGADATGLACSPFWGVQLAHRFTGRNKTGTAPASPGEGRQGPEYTAGSDGLPRGTTRSARPARASGAGGDRPTPARAPPAPAAPARRAPGCGGP